MRFTSVGGCCGAQGFYKILPDTTVEEVVELLGGYTGGLTVLGTPLSSKHPVIKHFKNKPNWHFHKTKKGIIAFYNPLPTKMPSLGGVDGKYEAFPVKLTEVEPGLFELYGISHVSDMVLLKTIGPKEKEHKNPVFLGTLTFEPTDHNFRTYLKSARAFKKAGFTLYSFQHNIHGYLRTMLFLVKG